MTFESFGFVELPETKYKELFIKSLGYMMEECASCPNVKHIEDVDYGRFETISDEVCFNSKCPIREILIESGIAHLSNDSNIGMCDGISIEIDSDTEVSNEDIKKLAKNNSNIYIEESGVPYNKLHFLGKIVIDDNQNSDFEENDEYDDNCEYKH